MAFLACSKCGRIHYIRGGGHSFCPVWNDANVQMTVQAENGDFFGKSCLLCFGKLKVIEGQPPEHCDHAVPLGRFCAQCNAENKGEKEVENMVLKIENFEAVIRVLADRGFTVQVPEKILRPVIIEVCKTGDKSVISRVMNSMKDAGFIKNIGFQVWEICKK